MKKHAKQLKKFVLASLLLVSACASAPENCKPIVGDMCRDTDRLLAAQAMCITYGFEEDPTLSWWEFWL